MGRTNKVPWPNNKGRLRLLHSSLDPRAACDARHPRALVGRVAVDVTAETVFEVEGVEVREAPVAHRAVTVILDTGAVVAVRGIVRFRVVTTDRRFLWWFRQTRAVSAQLGVVFLGLVTWDDEGKRSAAEEAGATRRYRRHLLRGERDRL